MTNRIVITLALIASVLFAGCETLKQSPVLSGALKEGLSIALDTVIDKNPEYTPLKLGFNRYLEVKFEETAGDPEAMAEEINKYFEGRIIAPEEVKWLSEQYRTALNDLIKSDTSVASGDGDTVSLSKIAEHL